MVGGERDTARREEGGGDRDTYSDRAGGGEGRVTGAKGKGKGVPREVALTHRPRPRLRPAAVVPSLPRAAT